MDLMIILLLACMVLPVACGLAGLSHETDDFGGSLHSIVTRIGLSIGLFLLLVLGALLGWWRPQSPA